MRRWIGGIVLLGTIGCRGTLSPLSNKLEVGQEPYIVFVADGEDNLGDLFASAPSGGVAFQITFTRLDERAPTLAPDGVTLAFLRRFGRDSTVAMPVLMNLLNGAEREVQGAGKVDALAWSEDGRTLYLRGPDGTHAVAAPPADGAIHDIAVSELPQVDSTFRVLLGNPAVGEAVPCDSGGGLCARLANGSTVLTREGRHAARWGSDSLLYVEKGELMVRPLGGGGTRVLRFTTPIRNPRGVTRFPGSR